MRKRSAIPERVTDLNAGDNPFEGDRQFVTALYRGMEILRCFNPGDEGLGNSDLSKRTGLGPSTVSRLTYTLTRLGYLTYDEGTGRYCLGIAVLDLGYTCLAGFGIRRVAQAPMQEMADKIGNGLLVALSIRDKLHMTYIACARSEGVMSLQMDVGSRLPVARSAAGQSYLALADEAERREIMEEVRRAEPESDIQTIEKQVDSAIEQVRENGYCLSLGQWRSEVNAIGVSFKLAQDHNRIYTMICGGAAYLLPKRRMETEVAPLLVDLVSEVSRRSGMGGSAVIAP